MGQPGTLPGLLVSRVVWSVPGDGEQEDEEDEEREEDKKQKFGQTKHECRGKGRDQNERKTSRATKYQVNT